MKKDPLADILSVPEIKGMKKEINNIREIK